MPFIAWIKKVIREKLERLGIRSNVNQFFGPILSERPFFVEIETDHSQECIMDIVTLQGSISGSYLQYSTTICHTLLEVGNCMFTLLYVYTTAE